MIERSPRSTLAAVVLSTIAANLTLTILAIALQPIAEELSSSLDAAAWLTIAPVLVSALVAPFAGSASDRYGARIVWLVGNAILFLGLLWSGLSRSMFELILARALTGLGSGLSISPGLAIAAGAYPSEERARPVSAIMTASALSPAVGVLLGGPAIDYFGFRILFLAQLPLMAVALFVGFVALPRRLETGDGRRFDPSASLLLGISAFALLLALNRFADWGALSLETLATMGISMLVFGVFLYRERRVEVPTVPPSLLRDRIARLALLTRAMIFGVYMGSFLVLPLALLDAGRSATEAALLLSPRPIVMGIFGPFAAAFMHRMGLGMSGVIGSAALAIGHLMLPFFDVSEDLPLLFLALSLMGFGLGAAQVATATMITARAPERDLGGTSSMITISTAIAGAIGMAGLLAVALHPLFGIHEAFVVSAALSLISLGLAWRLERRSS